MTYFKPKKWVSCVHTVLGPLNGKSGKKAKNIYKANCFRNSKSEPAPIAQKIILFKCC